MFLNNDLYKKLQPMHMKINSNINITSNLKTSLKII